MSLEQEIRNILDTKAFTVKNDSMGGVYGRSVMTRRDLREAMVVALYKLIRTPRVRTLSTAITFNLEANQ